MHLKTSIKAILLLFVGINCLTCKEQNEMKINSDSDRTSAYWINKLQLEKHPEGGYYRRTYQSDISAAKEHLPEGYNGRRFLGTAIYFLLEKEDFSAFHRLRQDEMWHFYEGSPVLVHTIDSLGNYKLITLGRDPEKNEVLQYVVPGGIYFASEIVNKNEFSLVGCTVTPGFDFEDFEMPPAKSLIEIFPKHETIISKLTRH